MIKRNHTDWQNSKYVKMNLLVTENTKNLTSFVFYSRVWFQRVLWRKHHPTCPMAKKSLTCATRMRVADNGGHNAGEVDHEDVISTVHPLMAAEQYLLVLKSSSTRYRMPKYQK